MTLNTTGEVPRRAARAAARIASTSASASARVTVGPAGTSVLPVVLANSQST